MSELLAPTEADVGAGAKDTIGAGAKGTTGADAKGTTGADVVGDARGEARCDTICDVVGEAGGDTVGDARGETRCETGTRVGARTVDGAATFATSETGRQIQGIDLSSIFWFWLTLMKNELPEGDVKCRSLSSRIPFSSPMNEK